MTIRKRAGVVALGICAVVMMGRLPIAAQEPAKAGTATAKKKQDAARRVPNYFGQIGLTPQQRDTIHGLQAKHQDKIDELEKQIATHKAEMLTECEGVLTDTQKKLLADLRKAAAEPAPAKSAEVPKAAK